MGNMLARDNTFVSYPQVYNDKPAKSTLPEITLPSSGTPVSDDEIARYNRTKAIRQAGQKADDWLKYYAFGDDDPIDESALSMIPGVSATAKIANNKLPGILDIADAAFPGVGKGGKAVLKSGKGLNVLSTFDGVSGGQFALRKAGIPYDRYYASEIAKAPIKSTQRNFPNTIQLGDIRNISADDIPPIDLYLSGSPCVNFAKLGNKKGLSIDNFDDYMKFRSQFANGVIPDNEITESTLLWESERLRRELAKRNPNMKFLQENVRLKPSDKAIFDNALGVEGQVVNSSNRLPINRERTYWTNIPTDWDKIRGGQRVAELPDIIENIPYSVGDWTKLNLDPKAYQMSIFPEENNNYVVKAGRNFGEPKDRASTLVSRNTSPGEVTGDDLFVIPDIANGKARKMTIGERAKLMGYPSDYFDGMSRSAAVKATGNGWNAETVSDILRGLK